MINKLKFIPQFFQEVKEEVLKVNWSSKQELRGALIVVLIALAFLTFYIAAVDLGLSKLMHTLLRG
jgi:preprotein translocase SecE subunit